VARNDAQREVTEARADREALIRSASAGPTRDRLRTLIADFTGLAGGLGRAPIGVRADIHAEFGVRLTYAPSTGPVDAKVIRSHQMLGKTLAGLIDGLGEEHVPSHVPQLIDLRVAVP
jgi:hypothetical protein